MAVATTGAKSASSADVLEQHTPLSRDSIKKREIVDALWRTAGLRSDVSQSPYGVWLILCDGYDAEENPKLYEVKTALSYFGYGEFRSSLGFEHEIARYEAS